MGALILQPRCFLIPFLFQVALLNRLFILMLGMDKRMLRLGQPLSRLRCVRNMANIVQESPMELFPFVLIIMCDDMPSSWEGSKEGMLMVQVGVGNRYMWIVHGCT